MMFALASPFYPEAFPLFPELIQQLNKVSGIYPWLRLN